MKVLLRRVFSPTGLYVLAIGLFIFSDVLAAKLTFFCSVGIETLGIALCTAVDHASFLINGSSVPACDACVIVAVSICGIALLATLVAVKWAERFEKQGFYDLTLCVILGGLSVIFIIELSDDRNTSSEVAWFGVASIVFAVMSLIHLAFLVKTNITINKR